MMSKKMTLCLVTLALVCFALPLRAEDVLTAKAREFLKALDKGDFALAVLDFDGTMLKVFGPDKLEAFWKTVPDRFGAFKNQGASRRESLSGYEIVLVTCEFAKVTLDARIVFDKAQRIAGFGLVPSVPPAVYTAPAYADPAKFEEREITVGTGDWRLPGTLAMPRGEGPFPAVVLIHGSGPNDRDESLGPNKPFKDLAWGLASRGIAVLRFDKRSKVYGARIVADQKLMASLTVKEETIDDALTAAAFLQKTDKIKATKVFILGHSLGGFLMPRIALAAKPLGVAGFISLAGLTRPLEDTLLRQMNYIYGLAGTLTDDDKKALDKVQADVARIKAFKKSDSGSPAMVFGAAPAYWLDLRDYQPAETAKSVEKPMLILQGGRDYQVTVDDFENWKKALGGRKDVAFKFYPKLNHMFFAGRGMATPNEYMQVHGSVARDVVTDIANWILAR